MSLKEKLKQDLATDGKVAISSEDLGEFKTKEAEVNAAREGAAVSTKVSETAKKDPMMAAGADGDPGQAISDTSGSTAPVAEQAGDLTRGLILPDEIIITNKEREAFLDALVSGDRFKLSFSIFNGRITGVLRSRSQAESHAIIQQLNRESTQGAVMTQLEYATRLRNMLLAAQVEELSGEAYVELASPLLQTVKGDETVKAGWLPQVNVWVDKNEGLVAALYRELQKFERKYWTMVENSDNQNFWNPVESTLK